METVKLSQRQLQLMLQIILKLDTNAVTGEGFDGQCKYCHGREEGYSDSHSFVHEPDCLVLDISELRRSML